MDYQQAMEFLEDTKKYGSQLGLKSIQNLMARLGDVQNQVPAIHIAGTNGKGSVGAMLSAVFCEAGYRVGHFSTPDVFSYEEEFRLNGKPIEKERLAEIFTQVADTCRLLVAAGNPHPTRFEVETAAAFLWFYEEKCDVSIIEVGMGGETDATNIIRDPMVSILTSISMDHMGFLGDQLTDIAKIKSGIIKKGCPVVFMEQQEDVKKVIQDRCREMENPFICSKRSEAYDIAMDQGQLTFSWKNGWKKLSLGLAGDFQIDNAVCVLNALEILKHSYSRLGERAVRHGLAEAKWPGRFEKIGDEPEVYLDGAHNEDAVRKLKKTIELYLPKKKILYIMGVLADKDYEKMIQIMFRAGDRVITVTPNNPRALDGKCLAEQLQAHKINAISCENIKDAVSYVLREAKRSDVILAFGSLSYLKEIKEAFAK